MISIATWCVLELLTCTADARVVVVSSNSTRGAKLAHRFDDVPGTDGFGPRIPATVSACKSLVPMHRAAK